LNKKHIDYFECYAKPFCYALGFAIAIYIALNLIVGIRFAPPSEDVTIISAAPSFLKFGISVLSIIGFIAIFDIGRWQAIRKHGYFKDSKISTFELSYSRFSNATFSHTLISIGAVLMFLYGFVFLYSSITNLQDTFSHINSGSFSFDREPEYAFWLVYEFVVLACAGEFLEKGVTMLRRYRKLRSQSLNLDENIDTIVQSFLVALIGITPIIVTSLFPASITTTYWYPLTRPLKFPPEGGTYPLPNILNFTVLLPGLICALGFITVYQKPNAFKSRKNS